MADVKVGGKMFTRAIELKMSDRRYAIILTYLVCFKLGELQINRVMLLMSG